MTQIKYPHIQVQLTGNDGNAFMIIGNVAAAIRKVEGAEAANAYADEAMQMGSYDDFLAFTMNTVTCN